MVPYKEYLTMGEVFINTGWSITMHRGYCIVVYKESRVLKAAVCLSNPGFLLCLYRILSAIYYYELE